MIMFALVVLKQRCCDFAEFLVNNVALLFVVAGPHGHTPTRRKFIIITDFFFPESEGFMTSATGLCLAEMDISTSYFHLASLNLFRKACFSIV